MVMWNPPIDLSAQEQRLCSRMKAAGKLYVFLRGVRHELFDEATQQQLEAIHSELPRGTPPVPASQMAMAMLLQAYAKLSDAEATRHAEMDAAWRMVLGTLDADEPLFSKTTLVRYRAAFVAQGFDQLLLRRTVEVARARKGFDARKLSKLRLAIDSAPLEGAGRVEDTINLLGRALQVIVNVVAVLLMMTPEAVRQRAGLTLLSGSSLKAMLDLNWGDPDARDDAAERILKEAERLEQWAQSEGRTWILSDSLVAKAREQFARIEQQDLEHAADGRVHIVQGVAKERQISISDPEMRHGHKSRSVHINGFKRYEAVDLDSGAVLEAVVLPANRPEQEGADKMQATVLTYGEVGAVYVDRAFLPSLVVTQTAAAGGEVVCRPYSGGKSERFTKRDFAIDMERGTVKCPAGNIVQLRAKSAHFSVTVCQNCPLREDCIGEGKSGGRSVAIHPQEALLQELQELPKTAEGRKQLRERTAIEHRMAHLVYRQGDRARYIGVRKNDYDVRRAAAIDNLFLAARAAAA
jgi:hypothetical protein